MDRIANISLCFVITLFYFNPVYAGAELLPIPIKKGQVASPVESSQSIVSQVKLLLQANKLVEAKNLTTNYLNKYPNDLDMILFLGLINIQEKNYLEAEVNLKKVLDQKPNYIDARVALIRLELQNKRFNNASAILVEGLKQNPNQLELIELKEKVAIEEVNSLRAVGNIDLAKVKAIEYLNLNSNYIDLRFILGLIYTEQKKYINAETQFKVVLQQKPNYLDARLSLIKIKIAQYNFKDAQTLLEQGLTLSPNDEQLQSLQMQLADLNKEHQMTRIDRSLETSRLTSNKPSSKEAIALKARSPDLIDQIKTLYKESNLSEAKNLALYQLKNHPDDLDALLFLGLIDFRQNDYNAAEKAFDEILNKKPSYMDARIALIRIKINKKEWKDAAVLVEQGLSQDSKQAELIDFREKIKQNETATVQVVPTLNKPALNKDGTEILNKIKALRAAGKVNIAKEEAIHYLQQNPKDSDVTLILGLIYFAEKNFKKAELLLQTVLKATPKYLDARVALIKIKLVKKDFNHAQALINEGLKLEPQDKALSLLKKQLNYLKFGSRPKPITYEMVILKKVKQYLSEKKYMKAEQLLKTLLKQQPNNHTLRIALADYYLSRHNDMAALILIREGLHYNSSDYDLLIKQGEVHVILRQYALAAQAYKHALTILPNDKKAKGLLAELDEYSPRYKFGVNEVGIASDNAYVNDLH
ncbi:MAG: tetratricopeptide repeat protein, partial [Tatlockia sp.]|nr:tetratricopeptide repeat protein [Tatlockia sp.]